MTQYYFIGTNIKFTNNVSLDICLGNEVLFLGIKKLIITSLFCFG